MYTTYVIKREDGKIYVGCTGYSLKKRLAVHWANPKSPLHKCKDKSSVVASYEFPDKKDAYLFEEVLIEYYNCMLPNGLNSVTGGLNPKGGHIFVDKMKKINSGKSNGMYGLIGNKSPNAKKIRRVDTGEVFLCAKDLSVRLGQHHTAISRGVRHGWRVSGNYYEYIK